MRLRPRFVAPALLAGLLVGAVLLQGPFWGDRACLSAETQAEALEPGQWVWSPGESPQDPVQPPEGVCSK